jgi:rhamnose transport system permease protein
MIRRIMRRHEAILALLTFVALAILSFQSDEFLTIGNLLNQGRLLTELGLISVAMTFVVVTGGIDLSVGSIVGLVAVLVGALWHGLSLPLPVAIACGIAAGLFAGLFNGLVITYFRVPPLIATLATLALYRGVAEGISQGRSVRDFPDWFGVLGQGEMAGVPVQLILLLIVVVVAAVVLGRTTFGRSTYALGANETAAEFSGLAVTRTKMIIYAGSGLAAALAAIVFVSRVSTTRSDMGTGLELDAITAVVLGGTNIFGGRGTIFGTVVGLFLIQALRNGLPLAGVRGDSTIMAIGVALIIGLLAANLLGRANFKKA